MRVVYILLFLLRATLPAAIAAPAYVASDYSASDLHMLQTLVDQGPEKTIELVDHFLKSKDVRLRMIAQVGYLGKVYSKLSAQTRQELLITKLFHSLLIPTLAGLKPVSFADISVENDEVSSQMVQDLIHIKPLLSALGIEMRKIVRTKGAKVFINGRDSSSRRDLLLVMLVSEKNVSAIKDDPRKMSVLALGGFEKMRPAQWIDYSAKHFPVSNTHDLHILNGILFGFLPNDVKGFVQYDELSDVESSLSHELDIVPKVVFPIKLVGANKAYTLNDGEFSLFSYPFKSFSSAHSNEMKNLIQESHRASSVYLSGVEQGLLPSEILTCKSFLK